MTKPLHRRFFKRLDTAFDVLFMLEYTRRYRWQEKVQRCQDLVSNAKEHLVRQVRGAPPHGAPPMEPLQTPPFCPVVRQVQQLKEELCSDEFVESLLADYAKDIPVTSAIQVCTSYWP